MPITHVVAQGDSLSSIAKRYGFADYEVIYDHPDNAGFKKKRPNPNLIFPGDRIVIPDREIKEVERATGKSHRFTLKRPKAVVRIVFEDNEGKPLKNAEYELSFLTEVRKGKTDGDGKLEEKVPLDVGAAQLVIANTTIQLSIGHLNPIDETPDEGISGIQARLHNLGYDPGPADGRLSARTHAALAAFQHEHGLDPTGAPDEASWKKLLERHGC
jgi:N-acetylmuramoyl-L-alanine amidase